MKSTITNTNNRTIYNVQFSNISDLYHYLKSNPKVNRRVFTYPSSEKKDSFYGVPLEQAIEYLVGGYEEGLDNFLKSIKKLKKIGLKTEGSYHVVRSIQGGFALPSLVAAGVNDCMLVNVRNNDANIINVYFQLAYGAGTSPEEIINRGLATLYIIQALEEKGYIINFKAFQLSRSSNEIIHISIDFKKPTDQFLNIKKCYFPFVGKEFFRRVLFRVYETLDVKDISWGVGYGRYLYLSEIENFYKTTEKDLIIATPQEMNIQGENLYEDTMNMITKLGIEDEFDTKLLIKEINKVKK